MADGICNVAGASVHRAAALAGERGGSGRLRRAPTAARTSVWRLRASAAAPVGERGCSGGLRRAHAAPWTSAWRLRASAQRLRRAQASAAALASERGMAAAGDCAPSAGERGRARMAAPAGERAAPADEHGGSGERTHRPAHERTAWVSIDDEHLCYGRPHVDRNHWFLSDAKKVVSCCIYSRVEVVSPRRNRFLILSSLSSLVMTSC